MTKIPRAVIGAGIFASHFVPNGNYLKMGIAQSRNTSEEIAFEVIKIINVFNSWPNMNYLYFIHIIELVLNTKYPSPFQEY